MSKERTTLAAWMLPLIVAAVAVSIVAGFYLGGPGLGMAVGALAAASLLVMAARNPPAPPIVPTAANDGREHLLVVAATAIEDGEAIERIASSAQPLDLDHPQPEVVVLAPTRNRFLDRWSSDTRRGRERAQRDLVISLASLAGAGVAARARVGDEDLVQAVADELGRYPATEVLLVGGESTADAGAAELSRRLRTPFAYLPPRQPVAQEAADENRALNCERSSAPPAGRAQRSGAKWRSSGPAARRRGPR
ncbi:MAG: hypothetical protein ABW065_05285 [Solirubrobacterales bacterium]